MAKTRAQMVALTRQFMDAEDSERWTDGLIVAVLGSVFEEEWSNILNAAPYYTFASRTVAQDVNGQIALTALNGGSGDAQQNYYRILNVSDGNSNYTETRFQDVPLATSTNYYPPYGYAYYLAGDFIQCLPIGSGVQMTIAVNYKPTNIADLTTDASVLTFPEHNELLLAYAGASRLLNKGGAESNAAVVLSRMANEERALMLDDLRRRTINPTRMAYPDVRGDWGTW